MGLRIPTTCPFHAAFGLATANRGIALKKLNIILINSILGYLVAEWLGQLTPVRKVPKSDTTTQLTGRVLSLKRW